MRDTQFGFSDPQPVLEEADSDKPTETWTEDLDVYTCSKEIFPAM